MNLKSAIFLSAALITMATAQPKSDPVSAPALTLEIVHQLREELCNSLQSETPGQSFEELEQEYKNQVEFPHTGSKKIEINSLAEKDYTRLSPLPCAGDSKLNKLKVTLVSEFHNCENCFVKDLRRSVVDGQKDILYLREGPFPFMGAEDPAIFFLTTLESPQFLASFYEKAKEVSPPDVLENGWNEIKKGIANSLNNLYIQPEIAASFLKGLQAEAKQNPDFAGMAMAYEKAFLIPEDKRGDDPSQVFQGFLKELDIFIQKRPELKWWSPTLLIRTMFKHMAPSSLIQKAHYKAPWMDALLQDQSKSMAEYYELLDRLYTVHYRSLEMAAAFGKRICESLDGTPMPQVIIRLGQQHVPGIKTALERLLGKFPRGPSIEVDKQGLRHCLMSKEEKIKELDEDIKGIEEKIKH